MLSVLLCTAWLRPGSLGTRMWNSCCIKGSARPVVMVCDMDPLGPQGLDLYAALLHRLGCHGFIYLGV